MEICDRSGARFIVRIEIERVIESERELTRDEERFNRAIEYGLINPVCIDELAAICCQSVSTFKRRFRARYSMSPHRWLVNYKLEIAYNIILEHDISTIELTKVCGFSNPSHFISLFRRRYGMTPSQLAKRERPQQCDNDAEE